VLQTVVDQCIATCKFLPSVSEIRALWHKLGTGLGHPSAAEAWGEVQAEIRRTGYIDTTRAQPEAQAEAKSRSRSTKMRTAAFVPASTPRSSGNSTNTAPASEPKATSATQEQTRQQSHAQSRRQSASRPVYDCFL
jgi:hypothetical protein